MHHTRAKVSTADGENTVRADCFIENIRSRLWIMMIFVVGSVIYAFAISFRQEPAHSTAVQPLPQGGQFQNAALRRCPYCPGFLDAQGRCASRGCPIYSPDWGSPTTSNGIPVPKVLIRELALEVAASEGKASVVIQSVYFGGNGDKAGLRVADRIVRFNGHKVRNVSQFRSIVARAKPERTITINVLRNGETLKKSVMIGEGEMEAAIVP